MASLYACLTHSNNMLGNGRSEQVSGQLVTFIITIKYDIRSLVKQKRHKLVILLFITRFRDSTQLEVGDTLKLGKG